MNMFSERLEKCAGNIETKENAREKVTICGKRDRERKRLHSKWNTKNSNNRAKLKKQ